MTLEEWKANPDSPEAEALARKILTSLYTIAAREKGYTLESLTITKEERKQ